MKPKRYMTEYANDILKRKKDNPKYREIEDSINRVIAGYKRGLISDTEVMKALVSIDCTM